MTIRTATVDGRKATVADMPDGYIKVLFEDGDMWIGAPAKKVKKVDLNWLMKGEADHAAHEASTSLFNLLPQPSKAQHRVGNYRLGHLRLGGLDISIENPQYSIRSGTSPDGKQWASTLQSHYGYIRRTEGSDGDHVDVFVRPEQPEDYQYPVFVIDQKNPDGSFDEHKCMLGWSNEDEAKAAYLANYDKDWDGIQAIRQFTLPEFKRWLAEGDTTKPVMDYVQKVVDLSLLKGGEGSGNFGHAGRPGEVGGSASEGGGDGKTFNDFGKEYQVLQEALTREIREKHSTAEYNKNLSLLESKYGMSLRQYVEKKEPKKVVLSFLTKEFTAPTSATSGIAGYDLEHGAKNLYPAPSTHIRQMMRAKAKQRKRKTKT